MSFYIIDKETNYEIIRLAGLPAGKRVWDSSRQAYDEACRRRFEAKPHQDFDLDLWEIEGELGPLGDDTDPGLLQTPIPAERLRRTHTISWSFADDWNEKQSRDFPIVWS